MLAVLSFSDLCDSTWLHSHNGLIISAFVGSILVFTFIAAVICVHIYHNRCKDLYTLVKYHNIFLNAQASLAWDQQKDNYSQKPIQ